MGRKFYKTCDDLEKELGAQEALELINYLEPKLIERQQQLIQIVRTKNYMEIARYAHRTKGSIRYYGTNILNDLLKFKKDWFIYKDVSDIYFSLGNYENAIEYAIESVLKPGEDDKKINLFFGYG